MDLLAPTLYVSSPGLLGFDAGRVAFEATLLFGNRHFNQHSMARTR